MFLRTRRNRSCWKTRTANAVTSRSTVSDCAHVNRSFKIFTQFKRGVYRADEKKYFILPRQTGNSSTATTTTRTRSLFHMFVPETVVYRKCGSTVRTRNLISSPTHVTYGELKPSPRQKRVIIKLISTSFYVYYSLVINWEEEGGTKGENVPKKKIERATPHLLIFSIN